MAKSDRGFASMNPQKARSIQSKGGKASKLTHAQAQAIGRKGGLARARKRRQQIAEGGSMTSNRSNSHTSGNNNRAMAM